jgi:D-glycero-alpha-D-manno-heptose-7-phosphate kinase
MAAPTIVLADFPACPPVVIISKTPLRISFVGGGTDLPDFAEQHGGAVVSTAIDKWVHVIAAPRFEGDLRVSYSRTEIVETARDVEHELVREALRVTGLPRGLEVVTLADVPSRGTGLGSSSAVLVGLLAALYAYQGIFRSPAQLAEEAARTEIEVLGKPIGRQDQYAAAVGGFNLIEFMRGGGVRTEPIVAPPGTLAALHRSLLLFYTGRQRSAADVLRGQRDAIVDGTATAALQQMRDLAYEMRDALGAGHADAIGDLLHRNWELKRSLAAGITDSTVDRWYQAALATGATGGKLLGAGAGGFLLLCAPTDRHAALRAALADLREVPFHFAARGTQITLFEPTSQL